MCEKGKFVQNLRKEIRTQTEAEILRCTTFEGRANTTWKNYCRKICGGLACAARLSDKRLSGRSVTEVKVQFHEQLTVDGEACEIRSSIEKKSFVRLMRNSGNGTGRNSRTKRRDTRSKPG